MADNTLADIAARARFHEARRRAVLAALMDILLRRSGELLSFDEVRARLNVHGQRALGHQVVPLDHVVGSEGRYSDFDRRFLPRSDQLKQRWSRISSAHQQAEVLPPVELYKISDVYFVRDGNHRVSVARQQGQDYIDAYVTELLVDVPLTPDLSLRHLLLKEEYSDFLTWTDLQVLRPDQRIEFSELGGYLELVRHINAHRYYLGQQQEEAIDRDMAVTSWYDNVYLPIVREIRTHQLLSYFPGRTEADLYRWIIEHRWYMRERMGSDPGPAQAALSYTQQFGQKGLIALVSELARGLLRGISI